MIVGLALLLGLEGCTGAPRSEAEAFSGTTGSGSAPVELRLGDAGAQPRRRLRYTFPAGRKEVGVLQLRSRLEQSGQLVMVEELRIELEVEYPTERAVELRIRSAATSAPDIPSLDGVRGARYRFLTSPIGQIDPPALTVPRGAHPIAAQYVEGALNQLGAALVARIPEDDVGVGATWSMDLVTWTLVALGEGRFAINRRWQAEFVQTAPDGRQYDGGETQAYDCELVADGIARRISAELDTASASGVHRATTMTWTIR